MVVELQLIFGTAHAEDFEAVDFWNKLRRSFGQKFWELLKENMREAGAEVGTVNVELLLAGNVYILASRAVDFNAGCGKFFGYADR